MAPEVRMKNCFLPSSQNHIDLCAGINAKGGKVPDTFSPTVFFLPIVNKSVAARATASIWNRSQALSPHSRSHRFVHRHHVEPKKHS